MLLEPCEKESVSAFHAHMKNGLWGSSHSCDFACTVPQSVSRNERSHSWDEQHPWEQLGKRKIIQATTSVMIHVCDRQFSGAWLQCCSRCDKQLRQININPFSLQRLCQTNPDLRQSLCHGLRALLTLGGVLGDVEVTVYPPAKSVATIKSSIYAYGWPGHKHWAMLSTLCFAGIVFFFSSQPWRGNQEAWAAWETSPSAAL